MDLAGLKKIAADLSASGEVAKAAHVQRIIRGSQYWAPEIYRSRAFTETCHLFQLFDFTREQAGEIYAALVQEDV